MQPPGPEHKNNATLPRPATVASGDFNADGRADLILPHESPAKGMTVLKGDGTGAFLARRDFATGINPTWAASGDFNGDGRLDLAVTSSYASSVGVMLGDGTGGFGTRRSFATQLSPSSVVAVDLNRDGRLDLVVSNASGTASPTANGNVSVLLGDGTGGFGGRKEFVTGLAPYSVISGDFNRDGYMDVVTANQLSDTVSMLPGDGFGGFGPARNSIVTRGPVAIASADFNRDGIPDLAVVGYDGTVQVVRNVGDGAFTSLASVWLGSRPRAISLADFNGDPTAATWRCGAWPSRSFKS